MQTLLALSFAQCFIIVNSALFKFGPCPLHKVATDFTLSAFMGLCDVDDT
jgi:hypothetical protein